MIFFNGLSAFGQNPLEITVFNCQRIKSYEYHLKEHLDETEQLFSRARMQELRLQYLQVQ